MNTPGLDLWRLSKHNGLLNRTVVRLSMENRQLVSSDATVVYLTLE